MSHPGFYCHVRASVNKSRELGRSHTAHLALGARATLQVARVRPRGARSWAKLWTD